MFTFDVYFNDNESELFEHINEVAYIDGENTIIVPEENIAKYLFPTDCDLHLYSEDTNITINSNDIRYLIVTNES